MHRIVNGTLSFYGSESRLIDDTKYGFLLLSTGRAVSPAAVTRSILTNSSEPAAVLSFHGKPHSNLLFFSPHFEQISPLALRISLIKILTLLSSGRPSRDIRIPVGHPLF